MLQTDDQMRYNMPVEGGGGHLQVVWQFLPTETFVSFSFLYVLLHYFFVTKFCPWASWGEVNPLGGIFHGGGVANKLWGAADKFVFYDFDGLYS